jgi:sulfate adenylyltransferase (ADP) / ATP adenylyltransferase
MLSPTTVKTNYLKCLQLNFLNFYPSRKALIPVPGNASPFEVRFCPALVAKKAEVSVNPPVVTSVASPIRRNPFLPFDSNLFLSELFSDYVLIFNKFCVVPEHLLIITRAFVEQSAEFSLKDFAVVGRVLSELQDMQPLAFYNSGPTAGASQIHRHFQVIPTDEIPIEGQILSIERFDEPFTLPLFSSFQHACIRKPKNMNGDQWYFEAYQKLKSFCNDLTFDSFNLLWTHEWMILIPRSREHTMDGLNSLNAMAFAGYLLVMNESDLERFKVIEALENVTFPVS